MLSRLTRALPSAPLLRCISFEYPAFRWHRLGGVRLPEDEEAPAPHAANHEPKPPSRFAGCYASIKKRQFQLRWWHYLLILFVILAATIPPIVVAAVRRARRHSWTPRPVEHVCYQTAEFTLRLDEPHAHFGRQDYLYKATTSFGVGAHVPHFALGAQDSHGVVRFVLDNSTAVHGRERNITVDVTAYFDDWNAFRNDMVVCRNSPWPYAATVTSEIYSRGGYNRYPRSRSAFEVTVRLPAGSDVSPVDLHDITARFKDMEVIVEDLGDRVTFDSLNFMTQNAPVHVESLTARSSIKISASNAPISGSFKAPTIDLSSNNGEMNVNASVFGGKADDVRLWRRFVRLFSSNRPITANVALLLDWDQAWVNSYPIEVRTSNAPVTLNVSLPNGSGGTTPPPYSLTTSTSYAPSVVTLPDVFVGHFSLNQWGGWQQPVVHFDPEHDPAGRVMSISDLSAQSVSGDVKVRSAAPPPGQLWDPIARANVQVMHGDIDLYI